MTSPTLFPVYVAFSPQNSKDRLVSIQANTPEELRQAVYQAVKNSAVFNHPHFSALQNRVAFLIEHDNLLDEEKEQTITSSKSSKFLISRQFMPPVESAQDLGDKIAQCFSQGIGRPSAEQANLEIDECLFPHAGKVGIDWLIHEAPIPFNFFLYMKNLHENHPNSFATRLEVDAMIKKPNH